MATHVRIELPGTSGLPEDTVTQTMTLVGGPGQDDADAIGILSAVYKIWTTEPAMAPVTGALGTYISPSVSRAALACKVKLYDLGGGLNGEVNTGSPYAEGAFTMPASSTPGALPRETALVATLYAANYLAQQDSEPAGPSGPAGDIRPKTRFRGRMFFGPFNQNAAESGNAERPRDDLRSAIAGALLAFTTELGPGTFAGARLGVWSRADASVRQVDRVGVDNAWDTIRSRGLAPTVRTFTNV